LVKQVSMPALVSVSINALAPLVSFLLIGSELVTVRTDGNFSTILRIINRFDTFCAETGVILAIVGVKPVQLIGRIWGALCLGSADAN
jgi:hypothetical protein